MSKTLEPDCRTPVEFIWAKAAASLVSPVESEVISKIASVRAPSALVTTKAPAARASSISMAIMSEVAACPLATLIAITAFVVSAASTSMSNAPPVVPAKSISTAATVPVVLS